MTPELYERITRGHPLFLTSLPNIKGGGFIKSAIVRSAGEVDLFLKAYDRPGQGVFYAVGHLREGATERRKENIGGVSSIWADVDLKHHPDLTPDEVVRRLNHARNPPTRIVDSGAGIHAYWDLRETVDVTDPAAAREVEEALKLAANFVGGDLQVCEVARLMRLPGSHNTKYGDSREVRVLSERASGYELPDQVDNWLEDAPIIGPPAAPPPKSNGHAPDAYADFARAAGDRLNVDEALGAMAYPSNVHDTQIRVALSLVQAGTPVEDIVARLMAATRRAAGAAGNTWDWSEEETTAIRRGAIGSAFKKLCAEYDSGTGEIPTWVPPEMQPKWGDIIARGGLPRIQPASQGGSLFLRDVSGVIEAKRREREAGEGSKAAKPVAAVPIATTAPETPKYRFKLTPFADMRPGDDQLYLVDELIPIAGLVDIWGKAKSLKSFWTLDLMYHVARGAEYRDRRVRQGTVVYCAFEGGHGYKKRIEAIRRYHGLGDDEHVPLYVMAGSANLIKDHTLLATEIRAQLGADAPVVVVLDTLNKSLVGSESKDVDMGAYVRAAEAIRDAFKCVVIIVHHCGLDETRPRGHTSLPGAVDAQLAVVRDGMTVVVTVEMMRDGPEEQEIVSQVEIVEVGADMHGKSLTSLVVVPSEATAETRSDSHTWPRALVLFERALKETLLAHGETISELDDPHSPQVRAVNLDLVRAEYYAHYPAKGDTEKQRQDSTRQAFHRCVTRAQTDRLIEVRVLADRRTMVWLARTTTRKHNPNPPGR